MAIQTIVEANVGAPSRTVGCYVIINDATRSRGEYSSGKRIGLWSLVLTVGMFASF